jgi:hypothetical protein
VDQRTHHPSAAARPHFAERIQPLPPTKSANAFSDLPLLTAPSLATRLDVPQPLVRSTGKGIRQEQTMRGNSSERCRIPPQVEEVAGHLRGRRRGRLPDRLRRVIQPRTRRRKLRLLTGGLDSGPRGRVRAPPLHCLAAYIGRGQRAGLGWAGFLRAGTARAAVPRA